MRKIAALVLLVSALFAEEIVVNKEEQDPICQMAVYQYPRWNTQIVLESGKKLNFICPKCMLSFYIEGAGWQDYNVTSKSQIVKILVKDYESGRVIDAKKAFYVFGSRILSPKGDDLIPFEYEPSARNFIKENGGSRILTFKDIEARPNIVDFLFKR